MAKKANTVTLPVVNQAGEEVSKVSLSSDVFACEVNNQVMFDAVQVYQANMRQATAKTKTRAEVSGGGKKPFRQKGTGRARAGSTRSPLWRHGGIVFGPKGNQNFKLEMNKKSHNLAVRSALTLKVNDKDMIVVDAFNFDAPKTKEMVKVMKNINAKEKTLFVIAEDNDNFVASARNIPGVIITGFNNLCVYDILNADSVVMTLDAIKAVEEELK